MPGDAISDIRTTKNTLSFWEIDDISNLEDAILALAVAPQVKSLETLWVAWVDKAELLDNEIKIEQFPGDTAVEELADTHRNAFEVTYTSLGTISKLLSRAIVNDNCKRIPSSELVRLVKKAYQDGRINLDKCSDIIKSRYEFYKVVSKF